MSRNFAVAGHKLRRDHQKIGEPFGVLRMGGPLLGRRAKKIDHAFNWAKHSINKNKYGPFRGHVYKPDHAMKKRKRSMNL